jgi:hypothetical protein
MKRWRAGLGLVAATGLAACGGDAIGPPLVQPGWLTVDLSTAVTDAGGLVLEVSGGPVDSVRVTAGYEGTGREVGAVWLVLLVGQPIASGSLGAIRVPNLSQADRYTVRVREAAARGTWQQRDPQSFAVAVRAP